MKLANSGLCGRGDDLVSFLYGEASASEARDFELHLQQCESCRIEMTSFSQVRESIGDWKHEALGAFVSTRPAALPTRTERSASAAIREFFALSPLWMKGAVAFATVLFFILAVLSMGIRKTSTTAPLSASIDSGNRYTQQQVDEIVSKAIAQHDAVAPQSASKSLNDQLAENTLQRPGSRRAPRTTPLARGQRPLTRSERNQLAADLRLSDRKDDALDLIGDRINQ